MILARYLRSQADRPSVEIETQDGVQTIGRGGFGLHLVLGEIVEKIEDSLESGDPDQVWRGLAEFFRRSTNLQPEVCGTFLAFGEAVVLLRQLNTLVAEIPFIHNRVEERETTKPPPWNYVGRKSMVLVHLIARTYGWALDTILELEPEIGFALVNEILVDEQLEQERQYSLSEVSRQYNPVTKTTHFRPLPRPGWMTRRTSEKVKIPRTLLPQGLVIEPWELKNKLIN